MIADPNLVNAIEVLSGRLSSVSTIMLLQLMLMIIVGLWFVFWTRKKDAEQRYSTFRRRSCPGRRYPPCRVTQKRDDMHFGIYKSVWYCRWCGNTYRPQKDTDRDGFCCPACKQAHHRAYKLYIDWITGARRKRTKGTLSRKMDRKSAQPGIRNKSNAKKLKKKLRFKRPVRIKFFTKKEREVQKSNLPQPPKR